VLISELKLKLDSMLGADVWKEYETETLVLELSLDPNIVKEDDVTLFDKVACLKVMEINPDIFFEDVLFFIYATATINSVPVNFEVLPHLTSLELALAVLEVSLILGKPLDEMPIFYKGVQDYVRDTLIEEGYSIVPSVLNIVGVGELPQGQIPQDSTDKDLAVRTYINAIYSKPTN